MTAELTARLESADGPDRELFEAAFLSAFGPEPPSDYQPRNWKIGQPDFSPEWCAYINKRIRFGNMLDAEAWTSAAEMLVPEGWNWMAGNRNQPIARAYVENGQMAFVGLGGMKRNPDQQWFECVASTPALALAAAALKARGG